MGHRGCDGAGDGAAGGVWRQLRDPLFAATLPLVWLTLRLGRRVAGWDADVLLVAAWLSMPALLLDGAAFSAAPWLYGADEAARRAGAGWLLWFVGVSLALAFYQSSRQGVGRTR